MIHLACYNGTVTAGLSNVDIPGVTDQSLTLSNNHYVLSQPAKLLSAYAQGTSIIRARVNTPKLRATSLPYVEPVNRNTLPGNLPPQAGWGQFALGLDAIDEIAFETSNNLATGTETHTIGAWFSTGLGATPIGQGFTFRATAAITATANQWTAGAITLDQVLPAGRYSVIGMRVVALNAIFGRLIFPSQVYRPGVVASADEGENDFGYVRMGSLGELGQFDSIAQPQLEIFANGSCTAQTVYMDCIRVR